MKLVNLKDQGYKDYAINELGQVWSIRAERFLKSNLDSKGYPSLSLKGKTVRVHRLLMQAFEPIENPEEYQVNHKDGDKTNNHRHNLEWCTAKQNSVHAVRTGLRDTRNETEETIHGICKLFEDGWSNRDIADVFGVSKSYISNIRRGHTFSYISCEYDTKVKRIDRCDLKVITKACELLQEGKLSVTEIASSTGLSIPNVSLIKSRKRHAKVSRNYEW